MHQFKKNPFVRCFFSWYIAHLLRKDFSDYRFNKLEIKADEALLLLANHFSWWDGFLMFQLNRVAFQKAVPCFNYSSGLQQALVPEVFGRICR